MEEIMQAYSAASAYYRPPARALVYSNFGRDEQLSQGKWARGLSTYYCQSILSIPVVSEAYGG